MSYPKKIIFGQRKEEYITKPKTKLQERLFRQYKSISKNTEDYKLMKSNNFSQIDNKNNTKSNKFSERVEEIKSPLQNIVETTPNKTFDYKLNDQDSKIKQKERLDNNFKHKGPDNWTKLIYLDKLLQLKEKNDSIEEKRKKILFQRNILIEQIKDRKSVIDAEKQKDEYYASLIKRKVAEEENNEKIKSDHIKEKNKIEKEIRIAQLLEYINNKQKEKERSKKEDRILIEDIINKNKEEMLTKQFQVQQSKELFKKLNEDNEILREYHKHRKIMEKNQEKEEVEKLKKKIEEEEQFEILNKQKKEEETKQTKRIPIKMNSQHQTITNNILQMNKSMDNTNMKDHKMKSSFIEVEDKGLKDKKRMLEVQTKIFLENQINEKKKKKVEEKQGDNYYIQLFHHENEKLKSQEVENAKKIKEVSQKYRSDVLNQIAEKKTRKNNDMNEIEYTMNKKLLDIYDKEAELLLQSP